MIDAWNLFPLGWSHYLIGGLCFGVGMVLASGCGSKTLIRIGSGNLKSVVVFLVLGVVAGRNSIRGDVRDVRTRSGLLAGFRCGWPRRGGARCVAGACVGSAGELPTRVRATRSGRSGPGAGARSAAPP